MIPQNLVLDPQLQLWIHLGGWKGCGLQELSAKGRQIGIYGPTVGSDGGHFDGVNDYINCGATPFELVGNETPFTVLIYARCFSDIGTFFLCGANQEAANGFFSVTEETKIIRWMYGTKTSTTTKALVNLDNACMIGFSYSLAGIDYGRAHTTVNGHFYASQQPNENRDVSTISFLALGGYNNHGEIIAEIEADILDLMIFNRHMSVIEIAKIYERMRKLR